ncbi:MAG: GspH/FimT family pseudopilin [Lysobacterales bacterium]
MSRVSRPSTVAGFTLIELLIAMMIVAILAAAALPSFQAMLQSNRVATRNNELLASLGLARSEAIKTNIGAGICASADGATCGTDWNAGWIVWGEQGVDDNAPQAAEILRVTGPQPNLAMTSLDGTDQINFTPRGLAEAASIPIGTTADYTLQPSSGCRAGAPFLRTLAISATGQMRSTKGNCP